MTWCKIGKPILGKVFEEVLEGCKVAHPDTAYQALAPGLLPVTGANVDRPGGTCTSKQR